MRFSLIRHLLVVRRNTLLSGLLYTPSIIESKSKSCLLSVLKFFSNSSKKRTQGQFILAIKSANPGYGLLISITGRFILLAKILAVIVLPVPLTPLNNIPRFEEVFSYVFII